MAKDPGIGFRVLTTVTGVKGHCNAGHQEGDTFEISCHNPDGLCGFFYHDIFPSLLAFRLGAIFLGGKVIRFSFNALTAITL